MAFNSALKPFVINATDIQFIIDQVTFRPLFRANGDIIVAWDGTGSVYDFNGNLLATGGTLATDQVSLDAIALVGTSYQNFTDLSGTRNVSGFWNNLTPALAHYGDTGQVFPRMADANYSNYVAQDTVGAPATAPNASDLSSQAPRITMLISYVDGTKTTMHFDVPLPGGGSYSSSVDTWNRVSTNDTQTTYFIDGHHVYANLSRVDTTTTTQTDFIVQDSTGEHVAAAGTPTDPVTTTGAVTISGGELDGNYHHFTTDYALAHQDYTVSAVVPDATEGNTTATDGTAINIKNVIDYTPRMISLTTTTAGVTYDTWANHQSDIGAADHTSNEIYYSPTTGEAVVLDWGQLETVANGGEGQVDTQARLAASAGQNDHFIGSINPGVAPSNGFFVLFGQFFDHGLDFIDKGQLDANGNNVTIKIALAVDDPLYGMKGPDGQPVTEITINRATVQTVDAQGSEYVNHVSPYIDQSQTYGSDVQRTALLREWVSTDGTSYHAGMSLLDGHTLQTQWAKPDGTLVNDTLPTLNELRAHIDATGRDALTWEDISNLRNRDAAGHVIDGASNESLLLDMNPRFDEAHLLNGMGENSGQAQKVLDAIATLNADVQATYGSTVTLAMVGGVLTLTGLPGAGTLTGASALFPWVNFANFSIMSTHPFAAPTDTISAQVHSAVSDILMASVGDHYIAGDGRANENFGLTSIHHIFHEEHNYQVQNLIDALHRQDIATNDTSHVALHEFQVDTGHGMNAAGDYLNADGSIAWNEENVFQGAKLIVEMEYQHAAVDQYARNVSPNIQEFVGYSPDKQPDVTLEYSQVAFRFGHSTLRETIDTMDPTGGITGKIMGYALHDAFLNPETFGDIGPASIVLGMTHQQQNAIDEFVTPALNQGLLGQPLDLAAINIARGRDVGMPTLNDFREAIGLARYTSWNDFGQNMQHQSSLVNFIAAYAFDGNMAKAQAIIGLADGSIAPSDDAAMGFTTQQAIAFLSGDEAHGGAGSLAFNQIDTWLGGLAEVQVPGGLLGETFDKVFVTQIESLMDGDRFYYLYRLAGQQFGEEVANGQLKDLVERNTGLVHLNGNIFGYADQYVDLGAHKEVVATGAEALTTGNEHKWGDIAAVSDGTEGIYSNGGLSNLNDGHDVVIGGVHYIQDTRLSADNPLSGEYDPNGAYAQNGFVNLDGTPNSGAESSEVIVGSKGNDLIYAQGGDDTVYGEDGNDVIFGGYGIDRTYGGAGNDTMYGGDNPDLMDGGSGDDLILGESSGSDINGADQLIGGSGNDTLDGGVGIDKLSAGSGDDVIYGGQDTDPFTHGGDGNDLVDGGSGGDILYGDNGDDIVVGGADQDQLFGGNGDDILRPGDPTGALTIGSDEVLGGDGVDVNDKGFDLIDFSDNNARPGGVTFDLSNQANPNVTVNGSPIQLPSFQIDGVVGSKSDDTLTGDDATAAGNGSDVSIAGNNWLIGGSGNDTMTGGGGNDIIVGGSIRLDALIGKYNSGYTHNNGNAGLTAADQLQDALYQGASHRVAFDDVLDNSGLLGHAETAMFDKHFTEMLRTEMFKDTVLGDDVTNTKKGTDTAVFTGDLAKYTLVALNATGQVVANPHANWDQVLAIKVTDNRVAADFVDANGAPLLDANGNPMVNEGTDLLIGVDTFQFADQAINPAAFFDQAPTLDLHYVATNSPQTLASDNFSGNGSAYARGTGWTGSWTETADDTNGSATAGQVQVVNLGSNNNPNNALRISSGDGASIQRSLDLSGKGSATVSYTVNEANFGSGETVKVLFAADGVNFVLQNTITSTTNNGGTQSFTAPAPAGGFSANAILKFEASSVAAVGGNNAHTVTIDNINVTTPIVVDQFNGNNYTAGYTEQVGATAIASTPAIGDPDDATIASARIVLTDAVAGDVLSVGTLPSGITSTIDTSVAGKITVSLSGAGSHADYQTALAAVTFSSTSDNPTTYGTDTSRHLDVTVNDGLKDSAVATTTINITAVNDPTVTGADHIVTNATSFVVQDALLLANDTDPDSALSISGTNNLNGLAAAHSNAGQAITVTDTGAAGGSFNYAVNGVNGAVDVTRQIGSTVTGTAANEILIGSTGNDTLNGGGGNDTIVWNASGTVTRNNNGTFTTNVTTDGRDFVDGGDGTDTFVLNSSVTGTGNGNNLTLANARADVSENFDVYTLAEAQNAGLTGLHNTAGEIVITRNGLVAAELVNVEEIVINTGPGNDKVNIHGDFTPTSLAYSTITINDADGGDTVDISGLTSAHRIVFHTDTTGHVIGDLRPQDVVDQSGPTGSNVVYSETSTALPDGVRELDLLGADSVDGEGNDLANVLVGNAGSNHLEGGGGNDTIRGGSGHDTVVGGTGHDLIGGGFGNDDVNAGYGNDTVFGGCGHDTLAGGFGADRLFGEAGDDSITGGFGKDVLSGGVGNDSLCGGAGADTISGGLGSDTIFFNNNSTGATADTRDIILDFEQGVDHIDLAQVDANRGIAGDQAFSAPTYWDGTGKAFTADSAGQARYHFSGADTIVDLNINADAEIDMQIVLKGQHLVLSASDFAQL